METIEAVNVERKLASLSSWFSEFRSALVAFSSGVDSTLLACVARKTLGRSNCIAVTSLSPAFASEELSSAQALAEELDIELATVYQDDLATSGYTANGVNRCYFCRSNLVSAMIAIIKDRNVEVCVDGTHLDDLASPRPGIRALREGGFRAPHVELRFGKDDVRAMARFLKLSNSERASESCLSSRVAYGQKIDAITLQRIEMAERAVRGITGCRVVRVRTIGGKASVEVDQAFVPIAQSRIREIIGELTRLGYSTVYVDPLGYQPGKMLTMFVKNEIE